MAIGVVNRPEKGGFVASGTLLENQAGTTNGFWQFINSIHPVTVETENSPTLGPFVGTYRIWLSNAPAQPANSATGFQLGGNFTAPTSQSIDAPYRWVKVDVTVYTSGGLNAYVNAGK